NGCTLGVIARTQARASRSAQFTLVRSVTARLRVARTEAESTSCCCAPASAVAGTASSATNSAPAKSARRDIRIDQGGCSKELDGPVEAEAELFGDPDGSGIRGADEADHALAPERAARVVERGARAFSREALRPVRTRDEPPELEARPAVRIDKAD